MLMFISVAWQINRTIITGSWKSKWNAQKITAQLKSDGLVHCWKSHHHWSLIFLKMIMEMLLLWTPNITLRWQTTSLCLNYDENVCLINVLGFSRMGLQPTQPEPQWTSFILSLETDSFPCLLIFLGTSICLCVIYFLWGSLKACMYTHKPCHWMIWRKLFT